MVSKRVGNTLTRRVVHSEISLFLSLFCEGGAGRLLFPFFHNFISDITPFLICAPRETTLLHSVGGGWQVSASVAPDALNTQRSDGERESGTQQPISFPSHPRETRAHSFARSRKRRDEEGRRETPSLLVAFTPFTRSPSGKFVRKLAELY